MRSLLQSATAFLPALLQINIPLVLPEQIETKHILDPWVKANAVKETEYQQLDNGSQSGNSF